MSIWSKLFGDAINLDFEGFKTDVVAAVKTEAKAQFDVYFPRLLALAKDEFEQYLPELKAQVTQIIETYGPQLMSLAEDKFTALFQEWFPILMTGLTKSVVSTSVKLGSEGVDKLTDLTPTQLDDQIIDPIAKELFTWLGTVFTPPTPPRP